MVGRRREGSKKLFLCKSLANVLGEENSEGLGKDRWIGVQKKSLPKLNSREERRPWTYFLEWQHLHASFTSLGLELIAGIHYGQKEKK